MLKLIYLLLATHPAVLAHHDQYKDVADPVDRVRYIVWDITNPNIASARDYMNSDKYWDNISKRQQEHQSFEARKDVMRLREQIVSMAKESGIKLQLSDPGYGPRSTERLLSDFRDALKRK